MVGVIGGLPRNIGRGAKPAAAVPPVDAVQPERDVALYELEAGDFKFVPLTDRGREFCDEINESEDCEHLVYPRSLEWLAIGMYCRQIRFRMMYPVVNYNYSPPPPRVGPARWREEGGRNAMPPVNQDVELRDGGAEACYTFSAINAAGVEFVSRHISPAT